MTDTEFEDLLSRAGFGPKSYPPNGRLNCWPSGKLFTPLDYHEIKFLVERVLEIEIERVCPSGPRELASNQ